MDGMMDELDRAVFFLLCVIVVIVMLAMSGCSSISQHPIDIVCKGKGIVSGVGYAGTGVGAGNGFNISADCGDGFEFKSGPAK